MKPKYKIGDIIVWDIVGVIAQIYKIEDDYYLYKFITYIDKQPIKHYGFYDIKNIDSITHLITPEEKLELL